ncbi:MAG: hypothetical protein LUO93_09485 [Methanomicrobiales archaeon]|nr:hypothetical protein [Methanomicrobiales archaeon]
MTRPKEHANLSPPGTGSGKVIPAIGVILAISLLFAPVSAHPPSNIVLSYNQSSQQLEVTITHVVRDTSTHFINSVNITRNGSPLLSESYTSQPSTATFTYYYPVPGKAGDTFEVTAACNLYGSLSETIILKEGTATSIKGGLPVLWPFHMAILVFGVICLGIAVFFARSRSVRKGWFQVHFLLTNLGVASLVTGIGMGVVMVALSGGPHLRVSHAVVGVTGLSLALTGLVLGYEKKHTQKYKLLIRNLHRGIGWVMLLIMTAAIASGIFLLGLW